LASIRLILSVLVAGVVAGGLGGYLVSRSPIGFDEQRITQLVSEAVTKADTDDPAAISEASIGPLIERYLLENPRVLERVSTALNAEIEAERTAKMKVAVEENRDLIYSADGAVVVGNPNGDVTLVEMYDYNCGYCRSTMPDVVALVDGDPNLKLVLRQFPILSQGSVDAAKVGVLVAKSGVDYWSFHQALFTGRGQVDGDTALRAAADLGLKPEELRAKLADPEVRAALDNSYKLAQQLQISGTPTFIIGDEVIPGAVGVDVLRAKIANVRKCGSTRCTDS
jgi:protein-disulfide isomerase